MRVLLVFNFCHPSDQVLWTMDNGSAKTKCYTARQGISWPVPYWRLPSNFWKASRFDHLTYFWPFLVQIIAYKSCCHYYYHHKDKWAFLALWTDTGSLFQVYLTAVWLSQVPAFVSIWRKDRAVWFYTHTVYMQEPATVHSICHSENLSFHFKETNHQHHKFCFFLSCLGLFFLGDISEIQRSQRIK